MSSQTADACPSPLRVAGIAVTGARGVYRPTRLSLWVPEGHCKPLPLKFRARRSSLNVRSIADFGAVMLAPGTDAMLDVLRRVGVVGATARPDPCESVS